MGKITIIESNTTNPFFNLAYEEYLLDKLSKNEIIFFLYQNESSVIIGKHQNPWKECRVGTCQIENISIARRITGGGTVYHDLGNLNYSFIMDRKMFDLKKQFEVILNALKSIGLHPVYSSHHDILLDENKISGNAFLYRKKSIVHHGTLLVSCDLEKMSFILTPENKKFATSAVSSISSKVVNLNKYKPLINVSKMKLELIKSFRQLYRTKTRVKKINSKFEILNLMNVFERQRQFEWIYGETPKFFIKLEAPFDKNKSSLVVHVQKGFIEEVIHFKNNSKYYVSTDITSFLKGYPYDEYMIFAKLNEINSQFENF